jgi:hypothetical protein
LEQLMRTPVDTMQYACTICSSLAYCVGTHVSRVNNGENTGIFILRPLYDNVP